MEANLLRAQLLLCFLHILFSDYISAELQFGGRFARNSAQPKKFPTTSPTGRHGVDEFVTHRAKSKQANLASDDQRLRPRAIPPSQSSQSDPRRIKDFRAPPELITISRPPGAIDVPNLPYIYDRTAGKGTTVYIIGEHCLRWRFATFE